MYIHTCYWSGLWCCGGHLIYMYISLDTPYKCIYIVHFPFSMPVVYQPHPFYWPANIVLVRSRSTVVAQASLARGMCIYMYMYVHQWNLPRRVYILCTGTYIGKCPGFRKRCPLFRGRTVWPLLQAPLHRSSWHCVQLVCRGCPHLELWRIKLAPSNCSTVLI